MTSGDDFDVRGPQLDDRGAEALLSGASSDVPDSWSGVARHLDVLRVLPATAPPGEELLDRMQAAVGTRRRRPAPTLRFRPRFVAVGMAGIATLLVSFGGLAAANALPSGVQRFVSDTLDHVGISVPSPADHGSTPSNGSNQGPGGHGPGGSTPAPGKGDKKGKGDKTGKGAQNGNGAGNPSSTAPAPRIDARFARLVGPGLDTGRDGTTRLERDGAGPDRCPRERRERGPRPEQCGR